jgi:Mn2+/Fe2+ NRAMP family transporter
MSAESDFQVASPPRGWERLKVVGPGLILAATGVGAGDMVTSLVAGTRFGTTLIWAIVIGAFIKFFLVEGLGRWYMATGQTIIEGWHSLGRWASGYFIVYLFLVTFVFGGAVISAAALPVDAMFPGVLPNWAWAVLHGVLGFVLVGIGRYVLFERVMEFFVGLMFITVVGLAIFLLPGLGEVAAGFVPRLPEGSLLYALGVIGGVGGTFTLASYTYWARERNWRTSPWIPIMRTDAGTGFVVTAIFMLAMVIIGTTMLYGTGTRISDEQGLVALSDPLAERFGVVAKWLFLIGFWSAVTSSILGAWNGAAYLFADYVRTVRRVPDSEADRYLSEKSPYFRGFLVWITFPPMVLLFFGQPVLLVVIYAALGALFMPFLAATLLWLLNSERVGREYRNRIVPNIVMVLALLVFAALAVQEIIGQL